MDEGHVIPETIRELLEQRGTFQGWLNRLDELGSEFRPEVAEKVRSDYAGRLTDVETELEGHRAELETVLADRTSAVEKVAGEYDARSAELEETQLRHAVGEFDDEEWERRRSEHQVGIDELEAELTAQRTAVESLQTVLGELTGVAVVVAVSEVIELEPPVPDEFATAEETVPEPEPEASREEDLVGAETEDAPESAEGGEDTAWMTQPFAEIEDESVEAEESLDAEVEAEADEDGEVAELEAEVPEEEAVAEAGGESDVEAAEQEAEAEPLPDEAEPGEFMDELEFLESLSLDDADQFDAVSAMLDEEEADSGADGESREKTEDL